jgi:hypothetical protein
MGTPIATEPGAHDQNSDAERARSCLAVLRTRHAEVARKHGTRSISECLSIVGTPAATEKVIAYLASQPFPHYEAGAEKGTLGKIDEDGTRTVGRFVGRTFQPV